MNRRHFLQTSSLGFGWLGLSALASETSPESPKRVIFLCMLGSDPEKLTHRHAGRDFRLTDVHGRVVKEIIA